MAGPTSTPGSTRSAGRNRGRPPASAPPAATDAEILETALDAFAEAGFAGTSVRDLARRLNVSHNLVPQRFGSKERLWYAAVDHGFAAVGEAAQVTVVPDDPFETLRRLIVAFVEATAARPAILRIINQEAAIAGPRLDYLFSRYLGPSSRQVESALAELQRCGRARAIPNAAFYFLLTHGIAGPLALAPLAERFG
ncbi:MAG TPA: TetR/AcrR family transcriptional regulator, partial [Acidimicrobiales bacterium]|nr:TetR/AcrR family transcriptional regulator [Acidimicrobiales bacterium]